MGAQPTDQFCHEAVFYAGPDDFARQLLPFIRDAVEAAEPILVVVSAAKIALLSSELGGPADKVRFADMAMVGRNPARIIPAWREFITEQSASGRRMSGIGETIWAERDPEELVECERHESLINLAFAGAPAWRLACPYDTESLPLPVLREAERNNPFVSEAGTHRGSETYRELGEVAKPFDHPLPEPAAPFEELAFDRAGALNDVRAFVYTCALAHGLTRTRVSDLALAANELASNSLRHGGGRGVLRLWRSEAAMICEVRDTGRIEQPLVGRERPGSGHAGGYGLWLANQLCDLVQVRTFAMGSVVRLRMSFR